MDQNHSDKQQKVKQKQKTIRTERWQNLCLRFFVKFFFLGQRMFNMFDQFFFKVFSLCFSYLIKRNILLYNQNLSVAKTSWRGYLFLFKNDKFFFYSSSFLATIKLLRWTASIMPSSILNSVNASSHSWGQCYNRRSKT